MRETNYGRYLAQARKRANITQEMLAEMIDCAVSTISRIETGEEHPRVKTFNAVDEAMGQFGLEYDEVTLEMLSKGRRVSNELLDAIQCGQAEKIDRILSKYQILMDKDDAKQMQYYQLSLLVTTKKMGMLPEEFIEACVAVYQMVSEYPCYDEIAFLRLRRIEYTILLKIAEAYIEIEEHFIAKQILKGLIKNPINRHCIYRKDRLLSIMYELAKLNISEKNYSETNRLFAEIFENLIDDEKLRMLFHNLLLQQQMCVTFGDKEGEMLIDSFFVSSKRLVEYMYKKYGKR